MIFVADPFFSVWPGIASLCLLILNRNSNKRKAWAKFGLVFCSLYLLYCITNKFKIDRDSKYAFIHQGIHHNRYFSTPAPFNNWLWFDLAETDSAYHLRYEELYDAPGRGLDGGILGRG